MELITKENCQVFHMSVYQVLNQEEWKWEECNNWHSSHIESPNKRFHVWAEVSVLIKLHMKETLHYDPYDTKCTVPKHVPYLTKGQRKPQRGRTSMCMQKEIDFVKVTFQI